jgi:hypothetical protein
MGKLPVHQVFGKAFLATELEGENEFLVFLVREGFAVIQRAVKSAAAGKAIVKTAEIDQVSTAKVVDVAIRDAFTAGPAAVVPSTQVKAVVGIEVVKSTNISV